MHAVHKDVTENGAASELTFARSRTRGGFPLNSFPETNFPKGSRLCSTPVKNAPIPRPMRNRAGVAAQERPRKEYLASERADMQCSRPSERAGDAEELARKAAKRRKNAAQGVSRGISMP
jgi:hypothetical protein